MRINETRFQLPNSLIPEGTTSRLATGDSTYLCPRTPSGKLKFGVSSDRSSDVALFVDHSRVGRGPRVEGTLDLDLMHIAIDREGPHEDGFHCFRYDQLINIAYVRKVEGLIFGEFSNGQLEEFQRTAFQATDGCWAESIAGYGSWTLDVRPPSQARGPVTQGQRKSDLVKKDLYMSVRHDNSRKMPSGHEHDISDWSALSPKYRNQVEQVS
jgi:hypothetical protein